MSRTSGFNIGGGTLGRANKGGGGELGLGQVREASVRGPGFGVVGKEGKCGRLQRVPEQLLSLQELLGHLGEFGAHPNRRSKEDTLQQTPDMKRIGLVQEGERVEQSHSAISDEEESTSKEEDATGPLNLVQGNLSTPFRRGWREETWTCSKKRCSRCQDS